MNNKNVGENAGREQGPAHAVTGQPRRMTPSRRQWVRASQGVGVKAVVKGVCSSLLRVHSWLLRREWIGAKSEGRQGP